MKAKDVLTLLSAKFIQYEQKLQLLEAVRKEEEENEAAEERFAKTWSWIREERAS